MNKILILFVSFCCFAMQRVMAQNPNPYVTARLMSIKGQWKMSYSGRPYKAFEGIPYAQPPTGERRFEPPEPITTPSNETIDATKEPNKCLQYDNIANKVLGHEDCLYLSVYVPTSSENSSLPVIIWFHEGGFQRGAGTNGKAKYLMDRDVILVTLNYRLGAFGFLSTGDGVVSGNMGLKDQNLALRWVAKNIAHFGGDPRKISLFGLSAGASSVHYHYLSKSSAGLFKNGVSSSGTALSLWAYDPNPAETTKLFAETLGCDTKSSDLIVGCLKNLPGDALVVGSRKMLKRIAGPVYNAVFVPVAERNASNHFVDRSPEEILRSGEVYDVPWISGVVSDEQARAALSIIADNEQLRYWNSNWEMALGNFLFFNRTLPIDRHVAAARNVRRHYLGDNELTSRALSDIKSHRTFYTILEKSTKLQAKANESPVYAYRYSYRATNSFADYVTGDNAGFGPIHMDDVFLVLENDYIDPTLTGNDRAMLETMLDFWYSIASTGKPKLSIDLPKVNPNSSAFEYLEIAGPNDYVLKSSDNFGEKKFWSSLGFDLNV